MTMNFKPCITRDPAICGGDTVVTGTRVTVRTILASLAEGMRDEDILADFPIAQSGCPARGDCVCRRLGRGRLAATRRARIGVRINPPGEKGSRRYPIVRKNMGQTTASRSFAAGQPTLNVRLCPSGTTRFQ